MKQEVGSASSSDRQERLGLYVVGVALETARGW